MWKIEGGGRGIVAFLLQSFPSFSLIIEEGGERGKLKERKGFLNILVTPWSFAYSQKEGGREPGIKKKRERLYNFTYRHSNIRGKINPTTISLDQRKKGEGEKGGRGCSWYPKKGSYQEKKKWRSLFLCGVTERRTRKKENCKDSTSSRSSAASEGKGGEGSEKDKGDSILFSESKIPLAAQAEKGKKKKKRERDR